jgi:L-fuconolactonase
MPSRSRPPFRPGAGVGCGRDMALDVPILDPHIHLWDPAKTPRRVSPAVRLFGWNRRLMRDALRLAVDAASWRFVGRPDYVTAPYLPADWRTDTGPFEVEGFIHVEAGWQARGALGQADETKWLEGLGTSLLRGVVGSAHLESPRLAELLARHALLSDHFVGVRDIQAHDADPGVIDWHGQKMDDPAWRRGFALLGERGLTFDAWVYGTQLPILDRLLTDLPETRVVLDHLGSPIGIGGPYAGYGASERERERIFEGWREELLRLGEHGQLHVKLSGLAMPLSGFDWHQRPEPPTVDEVVDRLGPLVEAALEAFGTERAMFASNFPMDKVSLPWTTLYEAYAQLTASRSREERAALFGGNAKRFYGVA